MQQPNPAAFLVSPLFRELNEVAEGRKETQAKRHHFVSEFLLRRFSGGEGRIFQLDVKTGQPRNVGTRGAASRRNFYTFKDEDGNRSRTVEAWLATVESHAAPIVETLCKSACLTDRERAELSFYIALLALRTPAARRMAQGIAQESAEFMWGSHAGDPETFARMYRESTDGAEASDDEIEEMRKRTLRMFKAGELKITDGDGGASTELLLKISADYTESIFGEMTWLLVRSESAQFVTSDRGVAMFDPTPEAPWSMEALMSSQNAETSIPLGPSECLVLSPGPPTIETIDADAEVARRLNLRTYGWADSYIYGQSQAIVTDVRRAARRSRQLVTRPKPFKQVILVESEPGDTRLADAHARRGWPRYMGVPGDDGKPRRMDYMVFGEDGDPVDVGVATTQLAKARALRRGQKHAA